jgi:hypothetical protein
LKNLTCRFQILTFNGSRDVNAHLDAYLSNTWSFVMRDRIRLITSGLGMLLFALGGFWAVAGESLFAPSRNVRLLERSETEWIEGGYPWWICVDRAPCQDPNPCPTTSTCDSSNNNPNCGIQYYPGYNNCSSTFASTGCGNILNGTCVLLAGGGWEWTPIPTTGTPACGGSICNAY